MRDLNGLCARLRGLREARGWTQEEAGTRLRDMKGWPEADKIIRGLENPLTAMLYYMPMELYYVAELYAEPDDPADLYRELCVLAGHLVPRKSP